MADEQRAQYDCARNAPQQGRVLALLADPKSLKENEEDEEIVDAQRRLDRISRHEFKRIVTALPDSDPDCE